MAITGSPGVIIQEEDLSSFVGADSVTTAAFVGDFDWGPVDERVRVTSEAKLIQYFGYPCDRNYQDWFTARNYLNYSSSLQILRVVGAGSTNANDLGLETLSINNASVYEFKHGDVVSSKVKVLARYPGEYGNKIKVAILNYEAFEAQKDKEEKNPATAYIPSVMRQNEIAVAIWVNDTIKEYGVYSIIDGSTDTAGYENYVFKHFNNNSNFIYLVKENFNLDDPINEVFELKGGSSAEISTGHRKQAWNIFKAAEDDDIQLLMQGGGTTELGQYIAEIAASRKDCLACVSPALAECVGTPDPVRSICGGSAKAYMATSNPNDLSGSFVFMDGNYKYQYDQYNDCYRWLPLNGDVAGLFAQLDEDEEPWMSPGGHTIRDCVKLAFYPTKAERDELFANGVNPVTNFKEEGNVLYGDWTRHFDSAFNFVGVRRCFLYMERNIKNYARKVMWKQNDEMTETTFRQTVEPFLTLVQGGRGISEFKVYLGDQVSSPDERDRGIFKAKILVKPVRSIRYVALVFTAVRSDISIEEVVE